jgi:hypothetical protein
VEVVEISNVDPWVILLLVMFAGFLIPSPAEIYRGVKGLFSGR